ncbi:MAG: UvrD-helicase domain-containing protein [Gammaproteobacteria bacterium]
MSIQHDQQQREYALDATQSFIVQAPAGSGKTELLIQRFLTLLTGVKSPEEVLAITFTKKAASEMRARIVKALKHAYSDPEPDSPHAKKTWHLAKTVLERDQQLSWDLIQNPNQLRIQTIDALCTYLTKQMPLLSQFGSQPDIDINPTNLYRDAVFEVLMHVEEDLAWSNAIAKLLLHLDNDLNKLHDLLVSLLAKRDQWLPYIQFHQNDIEIRKKLEHYLDLVVREHLNSLSPLIPSHLQSELAAIARYAADNLILNQTESPITICSRLQDFSALDKNTWLGLAKLLLTTEGTWRKAFNVSTGFPAASHFKNAEEKTQAAEFKQRATELMGKLFEHDKLRLQLAELNYLPRTNYADKQWDILQALLHVLKIVAAQLRISFQQHGKIDFIENSQAALTTLGDAENPTDLALALDYRICHILIDEFQDTSLTQYELLKRLTAGWGSGDGRTLFVVGDPMQSIYRFREAEVGLFIRMRQYGIGDIKLHPLTLSVNFRSAPGIVEWNNQHFEKIFPAFSDMSTGAVNYSPSTANKTDEALIEIKGFSAENENEQTQYIIDGIQKTLKDYPEQSIAILVRSRSHLASIIPALKKSALSYRALDIDPLASRQHIQDLLSLTCALLHPADRIAWLSILRAPWCGLTLSDLQILAANNAHITLWEQLTNEAVFANLSEHGKQRLQKILPILKIKIADRERTTLREWVESTWLLLGGPACLEDQHEIQDADAFFDLLQTFSQQYQTIDLDLLKTTIEKLFATTQHDNAPIQIMTIHSAKGLEFDTVILPRLERKMPNDDKALLSWMERPAANQTALLLAPIHATGKETDATYEYIHRQQKVKSDYESDRLLYVATTRAKQRLHLFFNIKQDKEELKAVPGSFLEKIWPFIKGDLPSVLINSSGMPAIAAEAIKPERFIKRLAAGWKNPIAETVETKVATHLRSEGFILRNDTPKIMGIVIHRILQLLSQHGLDWWQDKPEEIRINYLRKQLLQHSMNMQDLPKALTITYQAIQNTLSDNKGKWILHSHAEATSEFSLTAHLSDGVKTLVIDRTFVDEHNVRWIVDYKTTTFSRDDLQDFLDNEQKKYREKMQEYCEAIRLLEKRPVKLGLYFPALPAWQEWEAV